MNLTAARDETAIDEHVTDSIAIARYVKAPYVDVGSGGGFPALPIAIVTGAPTTMIESVAKKARFLADAGRELGLDVVVRAERAEVTGRDPGQRERFASATARAVGPVTTLLELVLPLLAVGGLAILQRGAPAQGEAQSVSDACLVLGATLEAEVAQTGSRRVLLVRKVSATPARFPRRAGIPSKRPLCT